MDIMNTNLNTIEDIENALEKAEGNVTRGLLTMLLASKKREAELLAKKTTKSAFTDDEVIIKALFVALRQHVIVNGECNAKKAFKASVDALNINFDAELQRRLFASSIQHCATCNILKASDIDDAMESYKDSVNQSKKLLPLIESTTWATWLNGMEKARIRAYEKQKKTVPVETVPVETVPVETVPVETVPVEKVIITTKKSKRK